MKLLLLLVSLFSITAGAVSYEQSFQSLGDGPDQYATFAAFPVSATDGELGMDQSSGTLYVWSSGSWQVVGAPGLITSIGALNGQAKNANAGAVSGNTIYMQSADATWPGVLTSADWSAFNAKEPAISAGTALQYWRGDKTFQTLDTAAVPENTNLYFTDARARTAAVADAINNGTTDIAPSQNAVFDALALKIDLTEKGANNGVATLDAGGKIPVAQLPSTVMEYQGAWNATTNTPALADGVGNAGDVYLVSVAGTQNLGSGAITFAAGDWAVYNGATWEKTINSNAVVSVNGQQGVVSLDTDDISEGATNLYHTNARAIGSTLTGYTAGAGIVSAADSVLSAIQKLDGNVAAKFTLPALTVGSVLFSDGSTIAQDNTNFFWDDTGNILRLRGDKYRFGYTDPYSRNALWAYDTDQVLLLGSWQSDGLPTNSKSEGIAVYGDEPLTATPISASDGAYARVKADRFGLYSVASGLPAYAGGQYYFRVDPTSLYIRDNSGAKTFEVTRSSGQIDTALGAGVVQSDASGVLSSAALNASQVVNAPAGSISSTDVQAAINELDTEKASTSGNVATATALAANGSNCAAGQYPKGVDASGASESCSAIALASDVSGTLPTGNGGAGTAIKEVPTGTVNNSNTAFTLSQTPVSNAAVSLFKNGRILVLGTDYTIVGTAITMTIAPNYAEELYADYRY